MLADVPRARVFGGACPPESSQRVRLVETIQLAHDGCFALYERVVSCLGLGLLERLLVNILQAGPRACAFAAPGRRRPRADPAPGGPQAHTGALSGKVNIAAHAKL